MRTIRGRLVTAAALCCVIATYLVVTAPIAAGEENFTPRDNISITSDMDFDAEHGVVDGAGTPEDPYVISGWQVHHIHIANTAAAVVIENNDILGQLILNWNGPNVRVVDNRIGDLRVNQNVKRTGAATGGLIARNEFDTVGQLRHFDGMFEQNIVKPPANTLFDPIFGPREAVQFDGFNGAIFRENTLYGPLDVKLHGHHHGSDFGGSSHGHSNGAHSMDTPETDHSKRYHEVFVQDNTIYSSGSYALRWTDSAHRGDDRTAPSEENEALNKPHSHWTKVHLNGNRLVGSGVYVDIFNADDQNHTGTNRGSVEILDNAITLRRGMTEAFDPRNGIQVWNAKDLDLEIADNKIVSQIDENPATDLWQRTAGIFLEDLDVANAYVTRNQVTNTYYGVRASYFTETVAWWVSGLATKGVNEDIYYDSTVSNPPRRGQ